MILLPNASLYSSRNAVNGRRVLNCDPKGVKEAVSEGADVNHRDNLDTTPIIYAAEAGCLDSIRYLAAHGADMTASIHGLVTVWSSGKDKATRDLLDQLGAPHPDETEASREKVDQVEKDTSFEASGLSAYGDNYEPPDGDANPTGTIEGTITNTSGKTYSYVEIKVVEYDANGVQLDTDIANTQYLAAHGTWHFKIGVLRDGVTHYKIVGLVS